MLKSLYGAALPQPQTQGTPMMTGTHGYSKSTLKSVVWFAIRLFVDVVIIRRGKTHLLQVIAALGPSGRFPSRLHCRQQQRDQDSNDGNHHQELDQRKNPFAYSTFRLPFEIQ